MQAPEPDFAAARAMMVDSQLRPNKVNDPRIVAAMRSLPRERFLPPALAALAYADKEVPLANGRSLLAPMAIAQLVQLLMPRHGERALVAAAGVGYGAAVLAACGTRVVALEDDPALLAIARTVLPAFAPTVALIDAPPAGGWKANAPYDMILIEGAVAEIPPALAEQLTPGSGRLVAVIRGETGIGQAVLCEPVEGQPGRLGRRVAFDCAIRALPALRVAPAFVF
jgi:protein-L-isoaspartate(D-aspartate) O-methyltransferase